MSRAGRARISAAAKARWAARKAGNSTPSVSAKASVKRGFKLPKPA
ncbi:MAG: hypothetical protein WCQ16_13220 [Verrucomicrobiae bacterium]